MLSAMPSVSSSGGGSVGDSPSSRSSGGFGSQEPVPFRTSSTVAAVMPSRGKAPARSRTAAAASAGRLHRDRHVPTEVAEKSDGELMIWSGPAPAKAASARGVPEMSSTTPSNCPGAWMSFWNSQYVVPPGSSSSKYSGVNSVWLARG